MKKLFLSMAVLISMVFVGKISALSYSVGDKVKVLDEDYYVIANSLEEQEYVTLLKALPLTQTDVNGELNNINGYLATEYYTSDNCKLENESIIDSECNSSYADSKVKTILDTWASSKFQNNELVSVLLDGTEYSVRIISQTELLDTLGYVINTSSGGLISKKDNVPTWVYTVDNIVESNYWTMSPYPDDNIQIYSVSLAEGNIIINNVYDTGLIRPVINVNKDFVSKEEIIETDSNDDLTVTTGKTEETKVKVEDTLLQKSLVGTIIGLVLIGIGISIYLISLKITYKKVR